MTFLSLLKRPSAFVPLGMSAAALTTVAVYVVMFGTEPQPDEGAAAHLWQLLMAGQLPVIAYFAFAWLPKTPKALAVLALQFVAGVAAAAPVFLLGF